MFEPAGKYTCKEEENKMSTIIEISTWMLEDCIANFSRLS